MLYSSQMKTNVELGDAAMCQRYNECNEFSMKVTSIVRKLTEKSNVKSVVNNEFDSWIDHRAVSQPRLKGFTAPHLNYYDWTLKQVEKQITIFAWSLAQEAPMKNSISCTVKQRNRLIELHSHLKTLVTNTRVFYNES